MVIRTVSQLMQDPQMGQFRASIHGRERADGKWEGWIEFDPLDRRHASLKTDRETTQSSLADTQYWASGLEPACLEGAFERARWSSLRRVPVHAPVPAWRRSRTTMRSLYR